MPRGDKSSYTDKQKRMAEHIEEGYEKRGVPEEGSRAAGLGDRQQGNRRRQQERLRARRPRHQRLGEKGGRIGGKASASRPAAARSRSAKKAAATRKRNATKRSATRKTARETLNRRQGIDAGREARPATCRPFNLPNSHGGCVSTAQ